ncbi:DNA-nicking endonuclease, Smr domain [Rhizobiales bacterium GAS188]|nr:DNA-nicking endonuclease, Smr domain [Rhizobiales bacterium GAS188]
MNTKGTMSTPRRPRWLSEDDLRVWAEVARTAKPLRGKTLPLATTANNASASEEASPAVSGASNAKSRAKTGPHQRQSPQGELPGAPPLAALERRFVQRLRRGTAAPGAVIDLHGLRQDEARHRLFAFLHRCQAEGAKAAIVITGKGTRANALAGERGVLRRAVPLWLAMPDLRTLVVGFQEAGAGLGGAGALIVRIRAKRSERHG